MIGLGGGVFTAALGSVLTAASWFAEADSQVRGVGTILLLLTIPLLVVGAESLDLREKKDREAREGGCHERE